MNDSDRELVQRAFFNAVDSARASGTRIEQHQRGLACGIAFRAVLETVYRLPDYEAGALVVTMTANYMTERRVSLDA